MININPSRLPAGTWFGSGLARAGCLQPSTSGVRKDTYTRTGFLAEHVRRTDKLNVHESCRGLTFGTAGSRHKGWWRSMANPSRHSIAPEKEVHTKKSMGANNLRGILASGACTPDFQQ
jgi:hypothetical protein